DGTTGALSFTIGDIDSPIGTLNVSGTSLNTAVVKSVEEGIDGTGANRTVTVTPAPDGNGVTTITLSVTDGSLTATTSFDVTVTAVNDPPTITGITNQTIAEDGTTGALSFTIGDIDSPIGTLNVSGTSLNT